MSWRDQMGPASFRGVPFFVETAERSGGRRVVSHEYPFRDDSYAEDMGRKQRKFPVEGHVVGDDYLAARDALLDALETLGPGEFVHPYHGTRRVIVADYRVRESSAEGGIARFSIEFVETLAAPTQPTTVADTGTALLSSASAARVAVEAEFLETFTPAALMSGVADALRAAALSLDSALGAVIADAQELARMKARVATLVSSAVALVNSPPELIASLSEVLSDLTGEVSASLLSLYAFNPGVRPPDTTANRRQERANYDALQQAVQRLAVIRAVELSVGQAFDSYDAAVRERDAVADLLDEQAEVAVDSYPALVQLRADLVKAIPGTDGDLPRLLEHTPAFTVPSLVLAHRLYGDVALEADLVSRNAIKHPGFVAGGQALEVLSHG